MKKILLALFISLAIYLTINQFNQTPTTSETSIVPEVITDQEVNTMTKTYSLEEVSQHSSKDNCWLVVEGKVYNVTNFVKSGLHPGGAAILQGCGLDATELFTTKQPHSSQARKMLSQYLIGNLVQ